MACVKVVYAESINEMRKSDLFNCGRICKYCGTNMDTIDIESLRFLHSTCWQHYRKNAEVYPFPKNYY